MTGNNRQTSRGRVSRSALVWKPGYLALLGVSFGLLAAASVSAEVLDLSGVIQSVDVSSRTVTIERKTPTGIKTLNLEAAETVGDLRDLEPGQRISVAYDLTLEVITYVRQPMTARQLRQLLEHKRDRKGKADLPPGAFIDFGYCTGYWMGVTDALGDDVQLPAGPQLGPDSEAKLLQYLVDHPEIAGEPAYRVIRNVFKNPSTP